MQLAQNIPLTSKVEYYASGGGFIIYEVEQGYPHKRTEHDECMNAKVWNWPRYKDGTACPACEKIFKALWEDMQKDFHENIGKYMALVGIGKRHHECTIENFDGPESVKKACWQITKRPADLFLTGNPGTGKTHLVAGIVRKLIGDGEIFKITNPNRPTAIFKTVPDLLLHVRATYGKREGKDEGGIVDTLSTVPILILDDLGAEKPSEWAVSTLYSIIDERYREERPTIVTSNLSLSQIASQLHERIASRLSAGKIVKLTGPDHRGKRP